MELSAGAEELRLLPATWSSATRPIHTRALRRHQREYRLRGGKASDITGTSGFLFGSGTAGSVNLTGGGLYLVDIATGTGGSLNTGNLSLSSASVYTNVNGPTPESTTVRSARRGPST